MWSGGGNFQVQFRILQNLQSCVDHYYDYYHWTGGRQKRRDRVVGAGVEEEEKREI